MPSAEEAFTSMRKTTAMKPETALPWCNLVALSNMKSELAGCGEHTVSARRSAAGNFPHLVAGGDAGKESEVARTQSPAPA